MPPINSSVTDTPACTPNTIMGTEGGMMGERMLPAAIRPVQVSRL